MTQTLSFELTSKLLQALQELDNKIIDTYSLLQGLAEEELEALHKFARVSMVGASTRIENALLTDLEGVLSRTPDKSPLSF